MRPVPSFEASRPPSDAAPPAVALDVQQVLVELARIALSVATGNARESTLDRARDRIPGGDEPAAVFVTLTEDGELRGCMGSLDPLRSLGDAVISSAMTAALDDPRFLPVTVAELPRIHIEISVLGQPTPIDGPDAFRPGIDGVLVDRNGRRGLLLPEVASEFSWGAIEMFDAVCRKAGLGRDAWRDPRTRLFAFRTVRFGGSA